MSLTSGRYCRLCLKTVYKNEFDIIGKIIRQMLDALLLNLNLDESKETVVCHVCAAKLQSAIDFKTNCLSAAYKKLPPCIMPTEDIKFPLEDVCWKNNTSNNISEHLKICRFCMKTTSGGCYTNLQEDKETIFILDITQKHIPELIFLDLVEKGILDDETQLDILSDIQDNPHKPTRKVASDNDNLNTSEEILSCDACLESLKNLLDFITKCCDVEKIITNNIAKTSSDTHSKLNDVKDVLFIDVSKFEVKHEECDTYGTIKNEIEDEAMKIEDGIKTNNFLQLENLVLKMENDPESLEDTSNMLNTDQEFLETMLFKCDKCSYETIQEATLKTHSLTHQELSEVNMYTCESCSFKTKYKDSLKKHILALHEDVDKITLYNCEKCSYKTKHKTGLKRHLVMHQNPSEITLYNCAKCLFETKYKHYLKRHMLVHKELSEVSAYQCEKCPYKFKRRGTLKRHMLTHRDIPEVSDNKSGIRLNEQNENKQKEPMTPEDTSSWYKCDQCSFKTKYKGSIKSHKLVHSETTVYKCDMCSYSAKRKSNLKLHVLNHRDPSEVPMYKCRWCSYMTKYGNCFKRHNLTHKDPSELTIYKCELCPYQTIYSVGIKKHMFVHQDPSELIKYTCEKCTYETKRKYDLKKHMLTHQELSQIILYKCESCTFVTKHKCNFKGHMLTHKKPSEITMYKCETCSYKTKFQRNLKRHMLKCSSVDV